LPNKRSRAKDSAFPYFKPRYGSWASRGKVCIKVCNASSQESGRRVQMLKIQAYLLTTKLEKKKAEPTI
jgi:hypothetical protein